MRLGERHLMACSLTRQRPGVLQPSGAFRTSPGPRKRRRPGAVQNAAALAKFLNFRQTCPMPRIIDWPHAPPHRLTERGTYFVTASTYLKAHHFRSPQRLEILQRGLLTVAKDYGWDLEAWAVFSNHYHFVAKSPDDPANLQTMLKELHVKLSGWVNRLDKTPGRNVWHNFRETQLTHPTSYFARLNYTHGNAVHHGLVPVASDYPWCSAAWFEETTSPAMVKSIRRFKTDKVKVEDDFDIDPNW